MPPTTEFPLRQAGPLARATRHLRRLLGRLRFCAHGRHEPSRRRVKWMSGYWFSRCRHCDVHMKRMSKRTWVVIEEADAATE